MTLMVNPSVVFACLLELGGYGGGGSPPVLVSKLLFSGCVGEPQDSPLFGGLTSYSPLDSPLSRLNDLFLVSKWASVFLFQRFECN